jgi:hypothetical protein
MNSKKDFKTDASLFDGQKITRKYAQRAADVRSDVVTPFAQSAIGAIVALAIFYLLEASPRVCGIIALSVFALTWMFLLIGHHRALFLIEEVTGIDFDQDGHIGDPDARVRVEVAQRSGDGQGMDFIDLPITPDELTSIAELILVHSVSFSRDGMSGVLSNELAAVMEQRGLIVKMSNNRRVLTDVGYQTLYRHLYGDNPPTETEATTEK